MRTQTVQTYLANSVCFDIIILRELTEAWPFSSTLCILFQSHYMLSLLRKYLFDSTEPAATETENNSPTAQLHSVGPPPQQAHAPQRHCHGRPRGAKPHPCLPQQRRRQQIVEPQLWIQIRELKTDVVPD